MCVLAGTDDLDIGGTEYNKVVATNDVGGRECEDTLLAGNSLVQVALYIRTLDTRAGCIRLDGLDRVIVRLARGAGSNSVAADRERGTVTQGQ